MQSKRLWRKQSGRVGGKRVVAYFSGTICSCSKRQDLYGCGNAEPTLFVDCGRKWRLQGAKNGLLRPENIGRIVNPRIAGKEAGNMNVWEGWP